MNLHLTLTEPVTLKLLVLVFGFLYLRIKRR